MIGYNGGMKHPKEDKEKGNERYCHIVTDIEIIGGRNMSGVALNAIHFRQVGG